MKGKEIVLSRECEKLFNELVPVLSGQWRSLGKLMGIEPRKIESFSVLYDDEEEATVEMLKYWVKHSHPTWHEFEDYIRELPMLDQQYLSRKIDEHINGSIVTTVGQDRTLVKQVVQDASETGAILHVVSLLMHCQKLFIIPILSFLALLC